MARTFRATSPFTILLFFICNALICIPYIESTEDGSKGRTLQGQPSIPPNLPNVLLFIVDDLGWNQVGYHANKVGNNEIQTPNLDAAVAEGIELNRGYVTPWWVNMYMGVYHTVKETMTIISPQFTSQYENHYLLAKRLLTLCFAMVFNALQFPFFQVWSKSCGPDDRSDECV